MSRPLSLATVLLLLSGAQGVAHAQAPAATPPAASMPAVCTSCHTAEAGSLQGYFENVAFKSRSIQLNLGTRTEVIPFDPATIKVVDAGQDRAADHLRDVRKGHEARIVYAMKDGVRTATQISFKGPIKITADKLVSYDDVAKLVARGPEAGGYTLIDSRPLPRFQEGTIPTAINLPFPAFDKFVDRLPARKDRLVIFFCQGVTCAMSPSSLKRAEKLGYTNLKVYREGWPEWTERNVGVLSAQFLKEAWLDKDIPHVLLDVRAPVDYARGHVPGAVSLPADALKQRLAGFPPKARKAPIMVYDDGQDGVAMQVARQITAAGYPNVTIVPGGLAAWAKAGYRVVGGVPVTQIAYAPKPRPGEIPADEFRRLASATPADTLILDVRNRDEANAGMIKGALLVPDEEIAARMAEIPKDRRIVAHCSTGIRAEMAYHKLKAAGYDAAFVKAEVEADRSGKFTVKAAN